MRPIKLPGRDSTSEHPQGAARAQTNRTRVVHNASWRARLDRLHGFN